MGKVGYKKTRSALKNKFSILKQIGLSLGICLLCLTLVSGVSTLFAPNEDVVVTDKPTQDVVVNDNVLEGQYISFLGDSITTLEGISDCATYNTTLTSNQSRYYANDIAFTSTEATLELDSWKDTYWGKTVTELNLELCVNNSWRGTSVSTARGADSCTSGIRATQLHNDNENITPDIIVIYIGTNDKSASAPVLGYESIDDLYDGTRYTADCSYFDVAYATMVLKVKNRYPNAKIYLCNLIYNDDLGNLYNEAIAKIATEFNCNLVDFSSLVSAWDWSDHTMDGLHPNEAGFDMMAECLIDAIKNNSN